MAVTTPLSWWKLDESSGNAIDQVGSLSAVNTSVTYGTGKINNGAIYNGSAYHTISDNTAIKPASDISISLWVNITSTSSYQMLLAKGENTGDTRSYEVRCFGTTTRIEVQMRTGGGSYDASQTTTAIGTGTWTHIVFTRTGTTHKIYINGVSDTLSSSVTTSGSIDYNADDLWFGQRNGAFRFNGKLDEVGIFNVALTQSEVNELYNSGTGISYPFTTSITVNPSVKTATFTIPAYTVTAERFITVSATAPVATFTIPNPTESGGAGVSPAVNTATFTIPAYTVVADGSVSINVSVQTSTFSIPTYTVTTEYFPDADFASGVKIMTFSIPTYRIVSDYWEDKFTQPANAWGDKFTQPANGWNDKY